MSFDYKFRTLRSRNSYDMRLQPRVSVHGDENTGEAERGMTEGSEENSIRSSPELVDERIKASLEPLHPQISALTQMMDCLIQSNSAKKSTMASSRGSDISLKRLTVKERDPLSSQQQHRSTRGILTRHGNRSNPKHTSTTTNIPTRGHGHWRQNSLPQQTQKGRKLANIRRDRAL